MKLGLLPEVELTEFHTITNIGCWFKDFAQSLGEACRDFRATVRRVRRKLRSTLKKRRKGVVS